MRQRILIFLLLTVGSSLGVYVYGRSYWHPVYLSVMGTRTVQDVIDRYAADAESRLMPHFQASRMAYPPQKLALLAFKAEKQLELWASNGKDWQFIHQYPIRAASGVAGPKLREGDRQVPEGRYQIVGLNPNSSYHLSMKLNYPNRFDLAHANAEGRSEPGSDIFIHGKAVSIGCLAMGDSAIEELFVLVNQVGRSNVRVLIAPHDARSQSLFPVPEGMPEWTGDLYRMIEQELANFRHQ